MSEFVRVRDKVTGHHFSMPVSGFDPDEVVELKQPATNSDGDPLPPKYKTTVDVSVDGKTRTSHAGTASSEEK